MIVDEIRPRAPAFSPLSTCSSADWTAGLATATDSPPHSFCSTMLAIIVTVVTDPAPRAWPPSRGGHAHVTVLTQISPVRNCFRRLLPKSLPVQLPLSPFARIFRMRILLVGAGGVGTAFARIAARREFADLVVADYDLARAQHAAAAKDGYRAVRLDARDELATAALLTEHSCDVLMNATDPRFVMPLFRAALAAGTHYLDMAMSLSRPHPDEPYAKIGVEPGLSDVFARYAADTLFREIGEIGVRDGANLVVAGYDFAPTFSTWTTIEECLNPPVIWEDGRGWYTTPPFSEPETFT